MVFSRVSVGRRELSRSWQEQLESFKTHLEASTTNKREKREMRKSVSETAGKGGSTKYVLL